MEALLLCIAGLPVPLKAFLYTKYFVITERTSKDKLAWFLCLQFNADCGDFIA